MKDANDIQETNKEELAVLVTTDIFDGCPGLADDLSLA